MLFVCHVFWMYTCCVLIPSPVDSFEVLREKIRSACKDAEEKEAAWRIVAAENARQRHVLAEQ